MVRRYTWLPTGFSASFTGGGVSGTLITSDAQKCQELVGFIQDKRVMWAPFVDEYGPHALKSVEDIRHYAMSARYLVGSRTTQVAIGEIQAAARDFMSTYTYTEKNPGRDDELLAIALEAFRLRIGSRVLALVEKYQLHTDLDLRDYRDNGVLLLQSWFKDEQWSLENPSAIIQ